MSNKHYIGLDLTGFEDKGEARPVSRVTLYVDDENVITAGDDTGLELTGDCPHATQAMADAILTRVKGYRYKMYSATSANLDPAAELGDGITAGGIYSVISKISDGGDGYPDLDAPGEAEPEDEFPTEGPITKAFNKKISDTRATITKTAEDITLSVSKTYSTKTETAQAKEDAISSANATTDEKLGDYSTTVEMNSAIKQTADSINQTVSKKVGYDEIISSINQSAEEVSIKANKISLEGAISANGTFTIDESGYLKCTGGTIGGFTIGSNSISYDGNFSNSYVYIGTSGIKLGDGEHGKPYFEVTNNGEVTALSGKIGNWEITTDGLYNKIETTGPPYGDQTSEISIRAPSAPYGKYISLSYNNSEMFSVSTEGHLYAKDAQIEGEVRATSGSFTGTVNATSGTFTGTVHATDGYFNGTVYANKIAVGGDAGYITGSQIGSGTISGGNIGSQTIGVGNMGTNSIENRCIQSGSIYNSTLSGGCVSNAKLDADLQNVIASAITASRITSGLASATSLSCTNFSFNGYSCYWKRVTSLTDGAYYIARNTY